MVLLSLGGPAYWGRLFLGLPRRRRIRLDRQTSTRRNADPPCHRLDRAGRRCHHDGPAVGERPDRPREGTESFLMFASRGRSVLPPSIDPESPIHGTPKQPAPSQQAPTQDTVPLARVQARRPVVGPVSNWKTRAEKYGLLHFGEQAIGYPKWKN